MTTTQLPQTLPIVNPKTTNRKALVKAITAWQQAADAGMDRAQEQADQYRVSLSNLNKIADMTEFLTWNNHGHGVYSVVREYRRELYLITEP